MSRYIDAERFDVFDAVKPEKYDTEAFMAGMEVVLDAIKDAPTIEPSDEARHAYYVGWCNGEEAEATRHDKPKWIPCSERLPEHDDRVLTYDTDGDINIMWFDGRDEEGEDVWKDDYSIEWCDIVAWMPLPEPWKGADD